MDINSLTRRELARCFGCTERTIGRWLSLGMPRTGKKYNLTDCIRWRTEQLQADKKADPNRQLERLRRHKADLAKLEYAKRAGELVYRKTANQVFRSSIIIAKTRLLGIPAQIGNELSGTLDHAVIAEIAEIAKRIINQALHELATTKGPEEK